MRTAAAMVAAVCAVAALAGCSAASADVPHIADAALPVTAAPAPSIEVDTAREDAAADDSASSGASGGAASEQAGANVSGAERTASIHAGPVRASIVATRASDGQELRVAVDLPRAFADDPLVTVDCSLDSDAGGLAVVIQDLAIQEGIATATLVIPEAVQGPGTYDGVLALLGAEGESVRAPGAFTVANGLSSGSFAVEDPATGESYAGGWECRAL
ncbi:hypothetical protein [Demequina sp. NBRC 110052]|uniref:hypothetical protein n=1 Tax=Demequina sp. NBRC 110052 TaxID=1570341 RepID=UPI00117F8927|nr:hypothetical protein [Demequina sp. NBRC 110052]